MRCSCTRIIGILVNKQETLYIYKLYGDIFFEVNLFFFFLVNGELNSIN